jgi:group I intron endonuclease
MTQRSHYNKDLITVAGVYYRPVHNDPKKLSLLKKGDYISLEREPTNPNDQNAIKVKPHNFKSEDWIGYIPREIAKDLAPILDRGSQYYCVIENIYTHRSSPRFVLQLSTFPVPANSPPKTQPSPPSKPALSPISEDPNSPTGKRFRKHTDIDAHIEKHVGISGIYVIWSRDYKCYVGQSKNIGARWKNHRYDLFKRAHLNDRLQKAWINNGANFFRFDLLKSAEPQNLDRLEQEYIQKLDSFLNGYNGTDDGQRTESPLQSNRPEPIKIESSPFLPTPDTKNLSPSEINPKSSSNKQSNSENEEIKTLLPLNKEQEEYTAEPASVVHPQKMTGLRKIPSNGLYEGMTKWDWTGWVALILAVFLGIIGAIRGWPPHTSINTDQKSHQEEKPANRPLASDQQYNNIFPQWYKDHAFRVLSVGRWDELIDVASRWKDIEPESEDAWYLLGEGYLGLANFPEALAAFRQVLRISPNNQEAWKKVAMTYIRAGRPKAARDIARKMKKVDPQLARDIEVLFQ